MKQEYLGKNKRILSEVYSAVPPNDKLVREPQLQSPPERPAAQQYSDSYKSRTRTLQDYSAPAQFGTNDYQNHPTVRMRTRLHEAGNQSGTTTEQESYWQVLVLPAGGEPARSVPAGAAPVTRRTAGSRRNVLAPTARSSSL